MSKQKIAGENDGITDLLVTHLSKWEKGQQEPYEALSTVAGFDVWSERPHLVMSARYQVQRDYGLVVKPYEDNGARGLRCLTDKEAAMLPAGSLRRIKRAAKRAAKTVGAIDISQLSKQEVRSLDARMAQLAAVTVCADSKQAKRLEKKQQDNLSREDVFRLFVGE